MLRRILLLGVLVASSLPVFAATQKYEIDPNHTQVRFTWNHYGFSNPSALLENIKGEIMLDSADLTKSSVSVTMPLSGLHTGVEKLDEHLKTTDFFDAAKYPNITFKSTKVKTTGTGKLEVTGNLGIHGESRPVTLQVQVNKIGENKMIASKSAGFDAEVVLKRSDFGVGKYVPMVSDAIHVHITVSADLAK